MQLTLVGHPLRPDAGPLLGLLLGLIIPSSISAQESRQSERTLKSAAEDRFQIGVGIGERTAANPAEAELVVRHFDVVTPENCMKPRFIHPAEATYQFDATDRFVAFARDRDLDVVGHCLLWAKDEETPPWMLKEGEQNVARDELLRRIEDHVTRVVERYADAASAWDVVNEAIADSGDEPLRRSTYSQLCGDAFLVTAFKAAKASDPTAVMIYNDYDCYQPAKRARLMAMLRSLKAQGAPIDAVGLQGHFELGEQAIDDLQATFDELRSLDLQVVISELDIDVIPRGRWWAEGGKYQDQLRQQDPYRDGCPTEILEQQAEQYAALFRLLIKNQDLIQRVSLWNLHDGQSWLNYFPWRRVNHPLLFDRQLQPKPAFAAVLRTLEDR